MKKHVALVVVIMLAFACIAVAQGGPGSGMDGSRSADGNALPDGGRWPGNGSRHGSWNGPWRDGNGDGRQVVEEFRAGQETWP